MQNMEVNSMVVLLTLLTILFVLGVLLFTVKSKIHFHLDTNTSDINVTMLWLYPFLRSVITSQGDQFILNIYLFNKRIYQTELKPGDKSKDNKGRVRELQPTDIHISAQYGFRDPFMTGLVSSAITLLSQLIPVESLCQNPDYLTFEDYISIDGDAELNLGRSLLKLV